MESEILKRKKHVMVNGEEVVDLTTPSIRYTNADPDISDDFLVSDDMAMRPDLLSRLAYGTVDYFDLICKFNAISNPYSIDIGDLILAPDLTFMMDSLVDPTTAEESEDIRNQYLDPSKKAVTDNKKNEYDEMIKNLAKGDYLVI